MILYKSSITHSESIHPCDLFSMSSSIKRENDEGATFIETVASLLGRPELTTAQRALATLLRETIG